MQPLNATELYRGQCAHILAINDPSLAARLYDMGIATGTPLQRLIDDPGGDPLVCNTPACDIALRQVDCRNIYVCL